MKKWSFLLVLVLVLLWFPPFDGSDAGQLWVVETLIVEEKAESVAVYAKNLTAEGRTLHEALETLKEYVPGELFLRQIKRLIFCGDMMLMRLPEEIPLGAAVYVYPGSGENIWQQLATIEPVLDAREKADPGSPRLSELMDRHLRQADPQPKVLEWEINDAA